MPRRTLKYIEYYPTPKELYDKLVSAKGDYKIFSEVYLKRDRAFCSILYLLALRVSEALRLLRKQIIFPEEPTNKIIVRGIFLSKSKRKGKPRKEQFRQEAWLPLQGPRVGFTDLILEYAKNLELEQKLFDFDRRRGWQIVNNLLSVPPHWLRAFGEDYLYSNWDHDLLAVADYVKVDARTLQLYIRRGYQKYGAT